MRDTKFMLCTASIKIRMKITKPRFKVATVFPKQTRSGSVSYLRDDERRLAVQYLVHRLSKEQSEGLKFNFYRL
jgi:hypothetical protein